MTLTFTFKTLTYRSGTIESYDPIAHSYLNMLLRNVKEMGRIRCLLCCFACCKFHVIQNKSILYGLTLVLVTWEKTHYVVLQENGLRQLAWSMWKILFSRRYTPNADSNYIKDTFLKLTENRTRDESLCQWLCSGCSTWSWRSRKGHFLEKPKTPHYLCRKACLNFSDFSYPK